MCDDRLEIRAQCKCRVAARTNDDRTRSSLQRARRGNDFGYDADVLRLVDSDGRESDDGRDGAEVNGLLFAGQVGSSPCRDSAIPIRTPQLRITERLVQLKGLLRGMTGFGTPCENVLSEIADSPPKAHIFSCHPHVPVPQEARKGHTYNILYDIWD